MKRRSFLVSAGSAVGAGALGVSPSWSKPAETVETVAGLPRRVLGRTGATISVVGFPGLSLRHYEQDECNRGIVKAFESGVNYYDVAPAYGKDGECEIKMGKGLPALNRDDIFLSCKTKARDKAGAQMELDRSLKRLNTDHIDLYQLHCLKRPEEVEQALGPGGAMETILKAKEQGKIKHIGFSAHTTKAAMTALSSFDFETCMFPINFVEYFTIGFGKPVMELAQQKKVAMISIKAVSRGRWPKDVEKTYQWWYRPVEDDHEMDLAMRWMLSQPGLVTGIPISFLDVLEKTIAGARRYQPISKQETEEARKIALTCESVFQREEQQVAMHVPGDQPVYPDSPHECCGHDHFA